MNSNLRSPEGGQLAVEVLPDAPKNLVRRFLHLMVTDAGARIFICAFGLRLGLLLLFPDLFPEATDKLDRYDPIAFSLIRGEGFSLGGGPTAEAAPIYPSLLAVIYSVFGHGKTVARIFLSLIDSAHCVLFYQITKRYFGGKVPILTALTLTIHPFFIYSICVANVETLFVLLQAVFIFQCSGALQKPTSKRFLISGMVLGITTLCRAVTLLLPVFMLPIFVLSFKNLKQRVFYFAMFLFGFTVVIAPWIVRNYIVFHRFVPVQTLGGIHLAADINVYRSNSGELDHHRESSDLAALGKMDAVERDRFFYAMGLEGLKKYPLEFLKRMGRRSLNMWYKTDSGRYETFLLFANGSLLIVAVGGIIISRQKWRNLLLFLTIVIYYVALHTVLVAIARYMLPVIPILIIFAMVSVNEALNRMASLNMARVNVT